MSIIGNKAQCSFCKGLTILIYVLSDLEVLNGLKVFDGLKVLNLRRMTSFS